ncbi:MAG: alpha/beta hydrolase [Deltaproteobacteria bacterium]|nr:alpha/beta hydrolase [Deltaproteobacteria bacterium]
MQQNGFFKTFDGTRLFYSVEGSGPPLVFCYGLVCSKLHWSYQMEYFRRNYTVIWFDYRGHHRSDAPAKPEQLTIDNIARDIECLLNELKIEKATLLGHSMGVNLVLEFYKRAPHRVDAMVLANGNARGPLETLLRSNFMHMAFPYIYEAYKKHPKLLNMIWKANGKSKIVPWIVGMLGFNPSLAKEEDIKTYVRMISEMDMIVTLQLLKDYETYDATPWLHRVNVPTLIIAGESDLIIPREAQEIMHQLIPGSQYELIRHGSHCPQMDIPELVNIMLERFLGEHVRPKYPPGQLSSSPAFTEPASSSSTTSIAQMSRQGDVS